MFGSKINQRDEGQKRHARRTRAVDLSRAESWVGLGGSWSRGATRGHGPPTWRSRGAHAGPRVDASAHGRAEKVASATVKESRPARIPGPPRPSPPHEPPSPSLPSTWRPQIIPRQRTTPRGPHRLALLKKNQLIP